MKKRYFFGILIILSGLALFSQRGDLFLSLVPKGIETNLQRNRIETLGDGLHIALCGAGGPMPSETRSGPCVAVIAAGKLFLVDTGSNGIRNLGRMGFGPGLISGVFLTHFHSDHIDGLGEVATLRWAGGSHKSPLRIYGPEGVAEVVDGFNQVYGQDAVYRHDHHGEKATPKSGAGMVAISTPLPADGEILSVYKQDGLTVEMLAVDHFPVSPAVAYRFSYGGRTALISGDTSKSKNIEKFAQNIDLLVHEALSHQLLKAMREGATNAGQPNMAKIFHDVLDYHASPVEAAETARDANVGHLLYYHVVPPLDQPGAEAAWLEGVDQHFSQFTLGQDGTEISLPAGSTDIVIDNSGL